MRIKNIRQYRTLYKETRPVDKDRVDEHFVGNYFEDGDEVKYGWFSIYHGDKDGVGEAQTGISNFLESFLEMAKDGQAVYEFLQNAVDAGAEHFTMIWGKDEIDGNHYVLVANNGAMFEADGIRSILNVGSSTKQASSQNIGKFGIGFKLAHRLVGQSNGLNELLGDVPSGPILFSWKNNEIKQLAEGLEPEPQPVLFEGNTHHYNITDSNPWLFKILATCFPAMPENRFLVETVRMVKGNIATEPVFSQEEYQTLKRWVSSNKNILLRPNYNEGSLFFIKLGKGKEHELAEKNLKEGIRFSLAVLQETAEEENAEQANKLHTIQLNQEEPIKKPNLEYHLFHIRKDEDRDDYVQVRYGKSYEELDDEDIEKLKKQKDIEVLFGFRPYDKMKDYFKGAPNFYLYFPLSEEVHNFNFILHSNAFYKASSRTFLHKGTSDSTSINERLLTAIALRLESELVNLFETDKNKFLNFYATLLTSDESQNHDRQWVKAPFIDEITSILKKLVPCKNQNTGEIVILNSDDSDIFIKTTSVVVPWEKFSIQSNWFYWNNEFEIVSKAHRKLNVKRFDLFVLLNHENSHEEINSWIIENPNRIKTLLDEISSLLLTQYESFSSAFRDNLNKLKLFRFETGELINSQELAEKQQKGFIVLHKGLAQIKDALVKANLRVTLDNYSDIFYEKFNSYFPQESQLRSIQKLIEIISNSNIENLSIVEKQSIFNLFRNRIEEGRKSEYLGEFRLFKNQLNECVPIKSLLKETNKSWLSSFVIHSSEKFSELERYLLTEESKIYDQIIYPYWEKLGNNLLNFDEQILSNIKEQIKEYFQASLKPGDNEKLISDTNLLFFQNKLIEVAHPFYNENLKLILDDNYSAVQDLLDRKLNIQIPDKKFLFFYDDIPFEYNNPVTLIDEDILTLTNKEARLFLTFFRLIEYPFFDHYVVIQERDDSISIRKNESSIEYYGLNYYTEDREIIDFVETNFKNQLFLLPENLSEYHGMVVLRDNKLFEHIIEQVDFETQDNYPLLSLVLKSDSNNLQKFFLKLATIDLELSKENQNNELIFSFIKRLWDNQAISNIDIQNKIVFNDGETQIGLSELDSTLDKVVIPWNESEVILSRSKILNVDTVTLNKVIDFMDFCRRQEYLGEKLLNQIFKGSTNSGITQELIDKFHEAMEDNTLINSHQLAFVVASKLSCDVSFNYSLYDIEDGLIDLTYNLIFPNDEYLHFFNSFSIPSKKYWEVLDLLRIKENTPIKYGSEENELFCTSFLFVDGFELEVFKESNDLPEFFKYLLKSWQQTPPTIRVALEELDWNSVLGFDPRLKVFGSYYLESEMIPNELLEWKNTQQNTDSEFWEAIGFNAEKSEISQLRNYLVGEASKSFGFSIPEELNTEQKSLLENTLVGLSDGFVETNSEFISWVANSDKHHLIKNILIKVADMGGEYRMLIHDTSGKLKLGSEEDELPNRLKSEDYELLIGKGSESIKVNLFSRYRIIFHDDDYENLMGNYRDELEIEYVLAKEELRIQEEEKISKIWNKDNDVQIIMVEELIWEVYVKEEVDAYNLGLIAADKYFIEYNDDDEIIAIYISSEIKKISPLIALLEENEEQKAVQILKNFLEFKESIMNQLQKHAELIKRLDLENNDEIKERIEEIQEENIEEIRKQLIEDIKEHLKYSYNWFNTYLEYLKTFEQKEETIGQKSISFNTVEVVKVDGKITNKYLLLKGGNSMIPVNIEAFENFSIKIDFRGRSTESIRVEGVSKKGQDLMVFIPRGIGENLQHRLPGAINIKIEFSPVLDLLDRLHNAYKYHIRNWEDYNAAIPPIEFIYGPPGTGKTTFLSKSIVDEISTSPHFKCLIIVPTNKAGDVIAKKILQMNPILDIKKLGTPTDPELEKLDDEIYCSSMDMDIFDSCNVVITTVHRVPYYQINNSIPDNQNHFLFNKAIKWDMVVFDEASMLSLPYIVFSLMSMNTAHFVVAGDPKQIPPVVDTSDKNLEELELDDESIYKMFGIYSFDTTLQEEVLRTKDQIVNLTVQYRSIPEIGSLISLFGYEGLLDNGRDMEQFPRKNLPSNFYEKFNSPISFIDFPVNSLSSIYEPRKLLYSSYHLYAGILVAETLKYFDACNAENQKYSIGIISPYKAQSVLMSKLIDSQGLSENLSIYCDTVHGFQGDECDIIIFIVNPTGYRFTGHKKSLLSKEYVYNVAMSRARDYLWIFHPFQDIKDNIFINRVAEMTDIDEFISSDEIERLLFKSKKFIEKNSFFTGHDNINVFGEVDIHYFIKADNRAIDIQMRRS